MCRTDLETIRTMADQVRRRERGKKRELLLLRQELRIRAGLAPDSAADETAAGTSAGAAALPNLPLELPPDREARLASKAAAQVAREAATLISAQVLVDPSDPSDRAPWDGEAGPSSAAASRPAEKRESLHLPGASQPSSLRFNTHRLDKGIQKFFLIPCMRILARVHLWSNYCRTEIACWDLDKSHQAP